MIKQENPRRLALYWLYSSGVYTHMPDILIVKRANGTIKMAMGLSYWNQVADPYVGLQMDLINSS